MIFETLSENMEGSRDGQVKKSIFEIFLCESTRNSHYTHTQIKHARLWKSSTFDLKWIDYNTMSIILFTYWITLIRKFSKRNEWAFLNVFVSQYFSISPDISRYPILYYICGFLESCVCVSVSASARHFISPSHDHLLILTRYYLYTLRMLQVWYVSELLAKYMLY
jgi:hypothetical protein